MQYIAAVFPLIMRRVWNKRRRQISVTPLGFHIEVSSSL